MAAPTTKKNPAFVAGNDDSYSQSALCDTRSVVTDFAVPCDAIWFPTEADLIVTLAGDAAPLTISALPAGLHKYRCKQLGVMGVNGVIALWR